MSKRKVKTIYSQPKPSNTTAILKAVAVILAIAAIVLLTVFIVNYFGTQHLDSYQDGAQLYNPRNGITYNILYPCPYWVNLDLSKPYATSDGVDYYKIVYDDLSNKEHHFDPKKMIASVEDGIVNIYLAEGFSLPTLEELNPRESLVCYVQTEEYPAGSLNSTDTQTVLELFKNGQESVFPSDVTDGSRMNIYLISLEHMYVRYTVEYFATDSGDHYLRDPITRKCIKATNELAPLFGSITGSGE